MSGTATENVFVLHESFHFPTLDRHRRISIYRPIGYDGTDERYPVIYMQDGQNLFDEENAFGREWCVDETLDAEQGKVIIVGIDNGAEHRMAEYMLHDHPDHGAAEGAKYLKDIVEVLKPFVDSVLRTRPEKEYTCIAGSSMGGLISFYAGLYFPNIFGAVGVLSPALWLDAPGIFSEAKEKLVRDETAGSHMQRWYFYGGALESETMVAEVATMVNVMREIPHINVTYQLDVEGIHDEEVWKNYFPNLYKWFTNEKSPDVIEAESHIRV